VTGGNAATAAVGRFGVESEPYRGSASGGERGKQVFRGKITRRAGALQKHDGLPQVMEVTVYTEWWGKETQRTRASWRHGGAGGRVIAANKGGREGGEWKGLLLSWRIGSIRGTGACSRSIFRKEEEYEKRKNGERLENAPVTIVMNLSSSSMKGSNREMSEG